MPVFEKELKVNLSSAIVLIVAQRVRSIMDADQIIVLDEGKVAAINRHKELLDSCTIYQEIVRSQVTEGNTA